MYCRKNLTTHGLFPSYSKYVEVLFEHHTCSGNRSRTPLLSSMLATEIPSCSASSSDWTVLTSSEDISDVPSIWITVARRRRVPLSVAVSTRSFPFRGSKEDQTPIDDEHPPWRLRSIALSVMPRHLDGLWSTFWTSCRMS